MVRSRCAAGSTLVDKLHLWILICVFLLSIASYNVLAYTEEENFAYIDSILAKLNNNEECDLPSFNEVNELNKCFRELKVNLGDELELKLNGDQKLVRITLLDQWDSFRKRMTDSVVIRSAKTRGFLGKVEKYQKAKFGDSVCTRIASRSKIAVTDKIFEKNPIVRYLKHLETHEVIERPDEPVTTPTPVTEEPVATTLAPQQLRPADLGQYFGRGSDDDAEPTTTTTTTTELTVVEEVTERPVELVETTTTTTTTPPPAPIIDDASELVDSKGVVHKLIGQYVVDYPREHGTQASSLSRIGPFDFGDEDAIDDPLSEIPEPSNEDEAVDVEELHDSAERVQPEFDLNEEPDQQEGVEYVDIELNDRMLAQLVHKQRRAVDPDPVINTFEWPDESRIKRKEQKAAKQVYDKVASEWIEFMKDPFPEPVEEVNEEPVTEPPLNMNTIQKQKQEFLERNRLANKMSNLVGWNDDSYPQARYLDTKSGKKRKNDSKKARDEKRRKKHLDGPETPFGYSSQQSPFGQVAQQQPNLYPQSAQSLFQQPQKPLFSQPQQPLFQQPQQSIFQQPQQSLFSQPQQSLFQQPQQSLFSQPQQSLFQQPTNMQQPQYFQQPSVFQPQQLQQQSLFQQPQTPLFQQQQQPSLFQQQQPSSQPSSITFQRQGSFVSPYYVESDSEDEQPKKSKKPKKGKKTTTQSSPILDKWSTLADNNFCKINYNKSYVPKHAKAAKTWIKSTTAQAAKRVLLAVEDHNNDDKRLADRVSAQFPKGR